MRFVYPAVIGCKEDGTYYIYFPDLEDCYVEGAYLEQAIDRAKEAEANWIMLELEETTQLPYHTPLEKIQLKEGERIQYIATRIKFVEGYD